MENIEKIQFLDNIVIAYVIPNISTNFDPTNNIRRNFPQGALNFESRQYISLKEILKIPSECIEINNFKKIKKLLLLYT